LKDKWPEAQDEFQQWAADDNLRLGRVHIADVGDEVSVATMIAQKGYGPSPTPRIRYGALREALSSVGEIALGRGARLHMPRIGAGQAGGDWTIIRELIDETLLRRGLDVTVYALPGSPLPAEPAQKRLAFA
jgi:hypothetical protein